MRRADSFQRVALQYPVYLRQHGGGLLVPPDPAETLRVFKERSAEAEGLRGEVDMQKSEAEASRREALATMVGTVETETNSAVPASTTVAVTANGAREVSTRITEVSGEATRLGDEAGRVRGCAADVSEAVSSLRRVIVTAVRSSAAA